MALQRHGSTSDDRELDRWFRQNVVKPRMEKWGPGWARLSEDTQRSELQAECWTVIQNSARIDNTDDPTEAAVLGRHVARIERGLQRYLGSL